MAFDPTINLGSIITLVTTIGGLFWAYHQWDKKIEVRHTDNKNQITNIDQKVDRIDKKIDDNTRTTNNVSEKMNDLNLKMEKHITADEIVQKQILTQIDKLDDRKP